MATVQLADNASAAGIAALAGGLTVRPPHSATLSSLEPVRADVSYRNYTVNIDHLRSKSVAQDGLKFEVVCARRNRFVRVAARLLPETMCRAKP